MSEIRKTSIATAAAAPSALGNSRPATLRASATRTAAAPCAAAPRAMLLLAAALLALAALLATALSAAPACAAQSNAGQHHSKGEDYASYTVFYGQKDENGFYILTEEALGCQLAVGESYRVTTNLTLSPAAGDYMAALVAQNNLIYIDANCTLTVTGSNGIGRQPGLPGIALSEGYSLCLMGEGKVVARGGNAGDGQNGHDAQNPWISGNMMYSGSGGDGGDGGGGAGAAIGTAGAWGTVGGKGGATTSARCDKRHVADMNGKDGQVAAKPQTAKNSGQLCVGANLTIDGKGGAAGRNGDGGKKGGDIVIKHVITKHLTGGSGGGGGGGGGGRANAFGMGGSGGWGGGGGGSGGSCWLTRVAWSSDDPPRASGGWGGPISAYLSAYQTAGHGQGEVNPITRGTSGKCTGGNGAAKIIDHIPWPTLKTEDRLTVLNFSKTRVDFTLWDGAYSRATSVSDYTGFANVAHNGSWYLQNKLNSVDGKSGVREFATIAGCTTVAQVKSMLTTNLPTAQGYTFKGWALEGDTSKMVYDAATGVFNTDLLLKEKKIDSRGIWMCPTLTSLTAVWEKPGYSVVYHVNGGSFLNADGSAAKATTYTQTGCQIGKGVQLCGATNIGPYKAIVAPKSKPAGTTLKGWATAVDAQGKPDGTVYAVGETVYDLNPEGAKTVHLYAAWEDADTISKTHGKQGSTAQKQSATTRRGKKTAR